MAANILVVDDDREVRRLLRTAFEADGYAVCEAGDIASAKRQLERGSVSLVALDLTLGSEDGLTLARDIRANSNLPIIMVTGKSDVVDRIVGLELGADDYVSKPFNLREVVARVRSVLRRSQASAREEIASGIRRERFVFGPWLLDTGSRELMDNDSARKCELTTGEFGLLDVFVRRPQRVLTRDEIMDLLKGHSWSPVDRSIDALIVRLRRKIEADPAHPIFVKTVRGVGYVFTADVRREHAH